MAAPTRFVNDVEFAGGSTVTFAGSVALPALSVTNANVATAAGIAGSKTVARIRSEYSQPNTTATSETRTLHVVYGATATILQFAAGSIAIAVGSATVTVDLKKNGTSILTGGTPMTLDSSNVARVLEAASLASTALVAGDWLEIVTVATAAGGTIPTGFFCRLLLDEDPA